jgi:mRNA interferase RelE/StbE
MYNLRILRRATKDIAGFPKEYARLISQHIDRLQENPRPPGAKRLIDVYRILYDIDDESHTVTVYRVKHRREAYR